MDDAAFWTLADYVQERLAVIEAQLGITPPPPPAVTLKAPVEDASKT